MQLRRFFISPGHNYFGRHGKPAGEHPTSEVDEIECVTGSGIRGDRFFDYKEDYKGQITFFAEEVFTQLCETLNLGERSPANLRRNILTSGIDLNTLIGQEFEIQGVRFLGTRECTPCYWMDQAYAPGTEAFLKGRGGLRAKILTSGTLSLAPKLITADFSS
ncbi:MAG: molybdenum cofactor biosysynthesis protein [Opitutaceae bacterium]|nr:molybdenum cofactor biosysynthesis protein [Opitutaceae bacterium]